MGNLRGGYCRVLRAESRPQTQLGFEGRTCVLLAWVLLGDAGGRGLRKLELLHHLGRQETHCRTVNQDPE